MRPGISSARTGKPLGRTTSMLRLPATMKHGSRRGAGGKGAALRRARQRIERGELTKGRQSVNRLSIVIGAAALGLPPLTALAECRRPNCLDQSGK